MKKVIMVIGMIGIFAASSLAADYPKTVEKFSESVEALVNEGISAEEAVNLVAQAVKEGKKEGLKGKKLAAKVHEAVEAAKAAKSAEHPAKGKGAEHPAKKKSAEHPAKAKKAEHPLKAKPKDHPAH